MNNQISKPQQMSFSMAITTDKYQSMIKRALTDPADQKRFTSAITSAVAINPALQACSPHTILSAALLGNSLNLSPAPQLGQFYMVPFNNKNTGVPDAAFIIGYKGLIQLALRSNYYKHLDVLEVREGEYLGRDQETGRDKFKFYTDEDEAMLHPICGYMATFKLVNGFEKTLYWSKEKVLNHADRYSAAFDRHAKQIKIKGKPTTKVSFEDWEAGKFDKQTEWLYSSYWYSGFDGMAKKTLLRQLIQTWGPMSIELQSAFAEDSDLQEIDDTAYPDIAEPETDSVVVDGEEIPLEPATVTLDEL